MKSAEEASRAVHDREKDLWSAINDYKDEGDSGDHRRVKHFLDLFASAVEVEALVQFRRHTPGWPCGGQIKCPACAARVE